MIKSSRFEVSRSGNDFVFRGGGFGHGATALAGDQHVDVAAHFGGSGQRLIGLIGEVGVVVFGNEKNSHLSVPLP